MIANEINSQTRAFKCHACGKGITFKDPETLMMWAEWQNIGGDLSKLNCDSEECITNCKTFANIQPLQQRDTMWKENVAHYEYQKLQPPQPLQNIEQTQLKQQASPEDIERNKICFQNWQNRLLNKNITSTVDLNHQLIISIGNNKSIISVYCASLSLRRKRPSYEPQWVYVNKETYEKYHADIYLGYNPSTLQPEGFAMRGQLFLTEPPGKPGVWVYGITREALDRNIDKLFDLDYLWKNSQLEPISYV